jgi:hypothetical protein
MVKVFSRHFPIVFKPTDHGSRKWREMKRKEGRKEKKRRDWPSPHVSPA